MSSIFIFGLMWGDEQPERANEIGRDLRRLIVPIVKDKLVRLLVGAHFWLSLKQPEDHRCCKRWAKTAWQVQTLSGDEDAASRLGTVSLRVMIVRGTCQ